MQCWLPKPGRTYPRRPYYDNGNGMDSAFDFDFGYVVSGILNSGGERSADFGTVDENKDDANREALWTICQSRVENAPMLFYSPFLTNHDQNRIMHTLGEDWQKANELPFIDDYAWYALFVLWRRDWTFTVHNG